MQREEGLRKHFTYDVTAKPVFFGQMLEHFLHSHSHDALLLLELQMGLRLYLTLLTFAGWLSSKALDDTTMTMRSSGALEGVISLTLGLLPCHKTRVYSWNTYPARLSMRCQIDSAGIFAYMSVTRPSSVRGSGPRDYG